MSTTLADRIMMALSVVIGGGSVILLALMGSLRLVPLGFSDSRGQVDQPLPFAVRGPYRWVRHPLYLGVIILIWASPELTADRLLFNLLWTAWIVVATILEETDLVADLGDVYRDYERKVPMLIPWRGRTQT